MPQLFMCAPMVVVCRENYGAGGFFTASLLSDLLGSEIDIFSMPQIQTLLLLELIEQ